MISCDKARHICNKSQYKEATFWERVKLEFHLLSCKSCSRFSKKNRQLTSLCSQANIHALSKTEKDTLKEKLDAFEL